MSSKISVELQNCSPALALLLDGNSSGASWPLVNTYQGKAFAFLGNDAAIDKRVAAYLLVSGLILGEFSTETLEQDDWQQSQHEAAEIEVLKETIDEQAQTIDEQAQTIDEQTRKLSALEAKFAALEMFYPKIAASL